jgi:enoyl-[acyl-carrier protein] reductase II
VDVVLREGVDIVVTAAGSPGLFTGLFRAEGVRTLHVVSSVRQARHAESEGVDAVIAEGVEAAARLGFDELPLFSLIPQVADAVSVPVVAAGGIVDARGVVAAYALGAEGVQLGTRFVAVNECLASPACKQAIIDAGDTDTVITTRRLIPTRSLKTEFTLALVELEQSGASPDELRAFLAGNRSGSAQLEGDLKSGSLYAGSSVGLIKDIVPAAEVIRRLVEGYGRVTEKLGTHPVAGQGNG